MLKNDMIFSRNKYNKKRHNGPLTEKEKAKGVEVPYTRPKYTCLPYIIFWYEGVVHQNKWSYENRGNYY